MIPEPIMVAVQKLFTIDDTEKILLNEEALKQLSNKDIQNDKIVVVSAVGEYRIGKSFLLSILEKYLNFTYPDKREENTFAETWMGDELEPLEGFPWKLSQHSVTRGADMSKIFRTTLANGEKVVIILLDTQGIYDDNINTNGNTRIFGLSTMVSSVQIFFLKHHITNNNLKDLKSFTDYGSYLRKYSKENKINNTISPYQQLLFYIRDWPNKHENPYGYSGGKEYMEYKLQVHPDQDEELRSIREGIIGKKCFTKHECFLMPNPGRNVDDVSFDGKFCDLENDYKLGLNEFIPHLLGKENLGQMLKSINGRPMTVSEFVCYLQEYTNMMNNPTLPTPKELRTMNIQLSHQLCMEEVRKKYEDRIDLIFDETQRLGPPSEDIKIIVRNAEEEFKKLPKLYGDEKTTETTCMKLKNEIVRYWNRKCKNKKKIDSMLEKISEKNSAMEKLTDDLRHERESCGKKVILATFLGAGGIVVFIGACMVAAPAVCVQMGMIATESASIYIGAGAVGCGAVVCVCAGVPYLKAARHEEEPTKTKEMV